jgi:radical SAM-linked protein
LNHPCRVRIRFGKEGDLRFISHRDLVRAMERMFRRAQLLLAMTQGFHPRPLMTFPAALALGVEARHEVAELVLAEPMEADEIQRRLVATAPPGLVIHSVEIRAVHEPKSNVDAAWYELNIPACRREVVAAAVSEFLDRQSWVVQRKDQAARHDFRQAVLGLELTNGVLRMQLRAAQQAAAPRPQELLEALGLGDWQSAGLSLVRADVELAT